MKTFILICIVFGVFLCAVRLFRICEQLSEANKLLYALLNAMQQIKNTFNKIN